MYLCTGKSTFYTCILYVIEVKQRQHKKCFKFFYIRHVLVSKLKLWKLSYVKTIFFWLFKLSHRVFLISLGKKSFKLNKKIYFKTPTTVSNNIIKTLRFKILSSLVPSQAVTTIVWMYSLYTNGISDIMLWESCKSWSTFTFSRVNYIKGNDFSLTSEIYSSLSLRLLRKECR